MAEPFNVTKHLRAIVAPSLKQHGFKVKGTRFLRTRHEIEEEVYFQRSQHNVPGYPYRFYLNLYCRNLKGIDSHTRLNFPSQLTIPNYYREYASSQLEGKKVDFDEFTSEQKQEISRYMNSLQWSYQTEDQLVRILHIAKDELLSKGSTYFDNLPEFIKIDDDRERWLAVMKFKSSLNDQR